MKSQVQKEWISMTEMQQMLSIGRAKAYELVATGKVPAVKIGRVLRVNRSELDAWLGEQRYIDPAKDSERTRHPKEGN